jgi:transcriptional regulator with XRE-family HTH domain
MNDIGVMGDRTESTIVHLNTVKKKPKWIMSTKGPHPVDVRVGERIRLKRNLLGFTQERLGDELGLTFQQIHKIEAGAAKVSASRLVDLSKILGVSIEFFFGQDDLLLPEKMLRVVNGGTRQEIILGGPHEPPKLGEIRNLVNAFNRVGRANRHAVVQLLNALAEA